MFSKPIKLFKLLGFEIKVDLTWLLLAVLVTWTLATRVFPFYLPGLTTATYWSMGAAGTLGLLVSIVFHELCHSLVARRYGLPIRGITLFIFGGVAEMDREPPSPKSEFLMALAGPVSSYLLALALYATAVVAAELPQPVRGVLLYLTFLNGLLATFNLVPAFPLDGGRMLRAVLWGAKGNIRWATRISSNIGAGFGLALIFFAVFAIMQGNFIAGMWWFLIGLFIRTSAGISYKQLLLQEALRGEPVRRFMNASPVTVSPSLSLQTLIDEYVYRHHFKMFPVVEQARPLGCITTHEIKAVPREQWAQRTVGEMARPISPKNTIAPDVDALQALSRMTETRNSRLMVVDEGRLVGVIARKDLLDFFALKLELEKATA